MKYQLTIRRTAELDITEAFNYYEAKRTGLGHDLLLCIEDSLSKIERNPLQYQLAHKNLRRCLIHRFPYLVFYLVDNESIIITAVIHARRDPTTWDERT
mgnify:FL=1